MAQDSGPEGIAIESLLGSITRIQVRAAHARSVVSQALAALDVAVHPANPGPALFVLPLGLFFGRLGCFLGGCCFGLPTHSKLAVVFPGGSPASYEQAELGLLRDKSLPSLPVHPQTPLQFRRK